MRAWGMLACVLLVSPAARADEPEEENQEETAPPPDPASAEKALAGTRTNLPEERVATHLVTRSYAGPIIAVDLVSVGVLITWR